MIRPATGLLLFHKEHVTSVEPACRLHPPYVSVGMSSGSVFTTFLTSRGLEGHGEALSGHQFLSISLRPLTAPGVSSLHASNWIFLEERFVQSGHIQLIQHHHEGRLSC